MPPRVLEIAMQTAVSRRGVSVIALPGDVALRGAGERRPRLPSPEPRPLVCPSDDELAALAKLLDGAALVEVLVHRRELAMPPSISLEQVTGFGIFMIKAVLSGRSDELIDLARTNLFR